MSNTRRSAAAGLALAISGTFIAVPAQADAAATSAHVVAKTATTSARATPAEGAVQSNYKSFSSTAKTPGQTRTATGGRSIKANASSSSTIYVVADPDHCTSELGTGTAADPYCLLQSAINHAVSGDTIEVSQQDDERTAYDEVLSITGKSNITIVGVGDGVGDYGDMAYGSALSITNSSNITIRNMIFETYEGSTLALTGGDKNITLDGDYVLEDYGTAPTFEVTGANSGIDITHTSISGGSSGSYGLQLAAGSSNVVLASDIISAYLGVSTAGDTNVDIVGNTIQANCFDVSVTGTSTGSSVENNVFEPALSSAANCTGQATAVEPDVIVDATAAAGVTSGYNDFTFAAGSTAAYSWAGTPYATLADFQAAVTQGAHDAVDPTADAKVFLAPANVNGSGTALTMDAQPVSTSLSIGTANTSAPGALATDYYGQGSYTDRGAIKYVAPALVAALEVYQTGARTVEAYAEGSVARNAYATYTYSWGDGTTTASTTDAIVTHVYAHPGTFSVSVTVTDVFGDTSTATVSAPTGGSDYVPVTPTRVLDTRKGLGTGGNVAAIGPGKTLALTIGGVGSIPKAATAVAVNITATDATAGGHINAYPAGSTASIASNLDFTKGKNVANMAVVTLSTTGVVDFLNGSAGTVDLIVDVSGYFVTAQADGYKQMVPSRILDTNTSTGGHKGALTPSAPIKLKVAGVGGVPADAKAVEVNLTVAGPTKSSLVVAYPDGGSEPTVSNVNFSSGQTIANAAIVPIGSDGYIDIRTPVGSNRMVVDVDGYFSANLTEAPSAYEPSYPFRDLDTREGGGPLPGYYYEWLPLGLDWWGNLYPSPVTGIVTNVTVTQVLANGVLTAFPDNTINGYLDVPNASSLNFTKGSTVANLVFSTPGGDGKADYLNNSPNSLQLIVDVFGYFQSS
ncbi:PKD domain-containing protein [Actinospica durhamensis]|uniref:PKD domain-containing protein n=1 Tax=Actinospica durhamensis TaxID=1508375 RepID=A0A941EGP2_9ACTN|nr:PKD domain-containing protein [Actinospica durhamensis]MBR7832280.1 PKD domain-containing protein [Actinospica durhamensis]